MTLSTSPETRKPLKTVEFTQGICGIRGSAVYRKEGDRILFSTINSAASSVNAAEKIIKVICELEGLMPDDPLLEFYDLSTPVGYPHRRGQGNEVQVDRLVLASDGRGGVNVTEWKSVPLDPSLPRLR